jgi:AmmeMemoRadiSam system protein A
MTTAVPAPVVPAPVVMDADTVRRHAGTLLALAWQAVRLAARGGGKLTVQPADYDEVLRQPGAAFVTLKRRGELRGCIGSPMAWQPLIEDVADNAHGAAMRDPRFSPLQEEELEGLDLSVSVLTPPQPLPADSEAELLAKLRPRVDGLIIEDHGRRALFLPAVWESLPDPARFLTHLRLKAGLPPDHWSPGFKAMVFQAVEIGTE